MEKCKHVSLFISLVLIFNVVLLSLVGCSKKDEFVPVLRFAVASDVHVNDSGSDVEEERLAKMFEIAYRHSEKSSSGYKRLDAALFVGDFTQSGTTISMQKFKSIVEQNIKPETKAVVSLGNHEFYSDGQTVESRFQDVFAEPVDEYSCFFKLITQKVVLMDAPLFFNICRKM